MEHERSPRNTIGILFTMSDFYRENRPGSASEFFRRWKKQTEKIFGNKFNLIFPPLAHDDREFHASIDVCITAGCSLLLVIPVAYASSGSAKEALKELPLPLLFISTSWDYSLASTIGGDDLFNNQSLHGVQDLANIIRRSARPFHIIAGHAEQQDFATRLEKVCKIGLAASFFFNGKIGRIGTPLKNMLDFRYNINQMHKYFRFTEKSIEPEELTTYAEEISRGSVEDYCKQIHDIFLVDPSMSQEELHVTARYSLGLERLVQKYALDAVALNFASLISSHCTTIPFLGASRLISFGIGYGGEGDTLTALLNSALFKINPETTFSELYSTDFGNNQILLSHMGECNISLANPLFPLLLKPRQFPWGEISRPGVPVFQMKPGKITITSISESITGNSFQLVVLGGEVLEIDEHKNLEVPYTKISLERDLCQMIESYSLAGGTHHIVVSYGDIRPELEIFARYCGMEYIDLR